MGITIEMAERTGQGDGEPSAAQSTGRPLVFHPRRDVLDTLEFYACVLWTFAATGWFTLQFLALSGALGRASKRSQYVLPPAPLMIGAFFVQAIVAGTIAGFLTWRRFAERFELTDTDLVWRIGYATVRFPLAKIQRIHPMGIVRITTSIKRGVRIWFSEFPIRESHCRNPLSKWISDKLPPKFIKQSETNSAQMYYDVSPRDIEGFLREVAARSPNLNGSQKPL